LTESRVSHRRDAVETVEIETLTFAFVASRASSSRLETHPHFVRVLSRSRRVEGVASPDRERKFSSP
jgi:hypothetical protein